MPYVGENRDARRPSASAVGKRKRNGYGPLQQHDCAATTLRLLLYAVTNCTLRAVQDYTLWGTNT